MVQHHDLDNLWNGLFGLMVLKVTSVMADRLSVSNRHSGWSRMSRDHLFSLQAQSKENELELAQGFKLSKGSLSDVLPPRMSDS